MLFIFVEGPDDKRFFNRIIQPVLKNRCSQIRIIEYATLPKKKVAGFLKAVKKLKADLFFVADINAAPCVTKRKEGILKKYTRNLNQDNIIVVIHEIESWYIAGLSDKMMRELTNKTFKDTSNLTKAEFNDRMPKKFKYRINYMIEILNHFSIDIASKGSRNKSFKYFRKKAGF